MAGQRIDAERLLINIDGAALDRFAAGRLAFLVTKGGDVVIHGTNTGVVAPKSLSLASDDRDLSHAGLVVRRMASDGCADIGFMSYIAAGMAAYGRIKLALNKLTV